MGINPDWVGYLRYCAQAGLGQYDLAKIELTGSTIAAVARKYKLHPDIDRELKWMGPMLELPPSLGSLPGVRQIPQRITKVRITDVPRPFVSVRLGSDGAAVSAIRVFL